MQGSEQKCSRTLERCRFKIALVSSKQRSKLFILCGIGIVLWNTGLCSEVQGLWTKFVTGACRLPSWKPSLLELPGDELCRQPLVRWSLDCSARVTHSCTDAQRHAGSRQRLVPAYSENIFTQLFGDSSRHLPSSASHLLSCFPRWLSITTVRHGSLRRWCPTAPASPPVSFAMIFHNRLHAVPPTVLHSCWPSRRWTKPWILYHLFLVARIVIPHQTEVIVQYLWVSQA